VSPLFKLCRSSFDTVGDFDLFIGVQPPNAWALWITVGFLILTGIIWVVYEQRRFQGPPIGDMIASARPRSRRPRRLSAKFDLHRTGRWAAPLPGDLRIHRGFRVSEHVAEIS
jgi:hypothetical protein